MYPTPECKESIEKKTGFKKINMHTTDAYSFKNISKYRYNKKRQVKHFYGD